jgi:hypothetical protein
MDGETFQKKLDAIEAQKLTESELNSKLIWLLIQYIKDVEEEWNPCEAGSVTSSPDSGTRPVSGRTYSQLPEGASESEC